MNARSLALPLALGLVCLSMSSCYTVLRAPRTAADVQEAIEWDEEQATQPRVGRFVEEEEWGDFNAYPRTPYGYGGGYSGGAGFPFVGYDSRYGMYGAGAYGYPSYGYGPNAYGYDPYYRDGDGYYVPPGYELVSRRQLEEMQETIRSLSSEDDPADTELPNDFSMQKQRQQEEAVWDNRTSPSRARESTLTPRPMSSTKKTVTSSGGAKPASRSKKENEKKPDIKSAAPERRRR